MNSSECFSQTHTATTVDSLPPTQNKFVEDFRDESYIVTNISIRWIGQPEKGFKRGNVFLPLNLVDEYKI